MDTKEFYPEEMIDGSSIRGKTVEVLYDECVRLTDRAVLLIIDGNEIWVPKSLILDADDDSIEVAEFFAVDNDLV